MDQRLSLITLGVGDLPRARRFYARLGWRESPAGNDEVAFFQLNGIGLSLFGRAALAADAGLPSSPPGAFTGIALAHNVRDRAAVAPTLAEAKAAGARIVKPAQDTFWGGHAGYFADPDGHLWEVAWNPGFPLAGDGSLRLP